MNVPVIRVIMRAIAQILLICTTVLVTLGGPAMFVTKVMYFKSSVASPTSQRNPSKPSVVAYSHCMGPGLGDGQGMGLAQYKTMAPDPCPYLRPMWTFLYNILEPIDPGPIPVSFQVPVFRRSGISQCNYFLSGWTFISQTFDSGPLFVLLSLRIIDLAYRV